MPCEICERIDPNLNNVENALAIGVSEATIRRHKTAAHNEQSTNPDPFFAVDAAAITSRGKSIRTAYGWEKITWSPMKAAMAEALTYDDLERAIEGFTPTPPPRVAGNTDRVVALADWQLGKSDLNGGSQETIARVMAGVHKVAGMLKAEPVAHLVLADLGDIIENFSNTKSQSQTNDLDLTSQVRGARRLLLEVLMTLAPLVPKVTYVAVPSNHCQVRAEGSKDLASTTDNDWGLELQQQIADVLQGRPGFEHVQFVRPRRLEEAVTVEVGGSVVGFVHGHQSKSPDKVAEWWKGQSHGRRSNLHQADYLLHGHYHNFRISQSGDARWLIGTPSSDPGSTWYTNSTGEQSTAGTLTFLLQDGQWRDMRIV